MEFHMSEERYFISSSTELSRTTGDSDETKYFENGVELAPLDDQEDFTELDFKKRIKQEVLNFINQSYDNIVVLAGAGASVVVNENGIDKNLGKTVAMIAKNVYDQLESSESHFSLQELANMANYNETVITEGIFNEKFNLENFLSNLLIYEHFIEEDKKEKFIKSKNKILQIIKDDTSYSFDQKKLKHDTFLNVLIKKIKAPNKLTIITTNYDTLFEDAAEKIGFTVMDGFTFSARPFFDSSMFEWNLVREIPNIKTKELEYKPNVINLLKIHGSLTWEYSETEENIIRKNKDKVTTPIMIFPSSNKYAQSYEEPYFDLFTKFQEFLKKQNTLLITTGFSFSDNHIAKMITSAIKYNPGLAVMISDYNIKQNHKNWEIIDDLRKKHFRVAFLKATLNNDLIDFLEGKNDY